MTTTDTEQITVTDRASRSVRRRLNEPKPTLMTTGRHPVEFDPTHVRVTYAQPSLTPAPADWDVIVEISGPRVRRDGTHGQHIKSRIYGERDCPDYVRPLVRAHHPAHTMTHWCPVCGRSFTARQARDGASCAIHDGPAARIVPKPLDEV